VLKISLEPDRKLLRERMTARCTAMMEQGFISEVQSLLAEGKGDWAALQSLGYKECMAFLNKELSKEDLVPSIVTKSMQLAKRQSTWFRKEAADIRIRHFSKESMESESVLMESLHSFLLSQRATQT